LTDNPFKEGKQLNSPVKEIYVATGDVVDSRKLQKAGVNFRDHLRDGWNEITSSLFISTVAPFEFRGGDSFQVALGDLKQSVMVMILLFAHFKSLQTKEREMNLRISLGIGEGRINKGTVHESEGTAFENSGLILETMKKGQDLFRVSVSDNSEYIANRPFHYSCTCFETLLKQWTPTQARRIYQYLLGKKVTVISEEENRSQATVSESLKAGSLSLVEKFPQHIQDLYDLYEGRFRNEF
jgi:hypothetical protein